MAAIAASRTSTGLCGGIDVAMPTAIPVAPLTRRFGKRAGRTIGSKWTPSKFGFQSTVRFLISERSSTARGRRRASV